MNKYELRGKTVLLTGGSRGLGLALARELTREGANLVICARDESELDRAQTELRLKGGNVLAVTCDVTDAGQVKDLVARTVERFGSVDVLINNAGIIEVGPMESMTLEDFESAMKIHCYAPLHTIREVVPHMKQQGQGRIVNIASIGGKVAVPHLLPYTASKFALVGLSEGLRAELATHNITVTTVCPGLMRTGSAPHAVFKGQSQAEYAWFSTSSVLPMTTISAETAAQRIVDAMKNGRAEVVLSVPAWILDKVHGLAPGLTSSVLQWVNRFLPGPTGATEGTQPATSGQPAQSASTSLGSWFSARLQAAARQYNQ